MESVVRLLGQEFSRSLGQPVVVENKPGAGTVIGVDAAAKALPDGYTFVGVANSFTVNATLVPRLPYDSLRDLQPVGLMARTTNVLAAHPGVPAKTLAELVDLARCNPGKYTYGATEQGGYPPPRNSPIPEGTLNLQASTLDLISDSLRKL